MPDRDFFGCPESEIADIASDLTMIGGKVVYASGSFAAQDEGELPPAMPDWSPVRNFGGFAGWGDHQGKPLQMVARRNAASCGCDKRCSVHGHEHATAWTAALPISDLKGFWGALGCACWAV